MNCPSCSAWIRVAAAVGLVISAYAASAQVNQSLPMPGDELWVARHEGGSGRPESIAASADGTRVFVTGHSTDFDTNATWISTVGYAVDTGAQIWAASYSGPDDGNAWARDVAVSPDGSRVFVTGSTLDHDTALDYVTVAYDTATGVQLWVSRYDGPGGAIDEAQGVVATADKVFVTGASAGTDAPAGASDYATVAYDAQSGDELWLARYDGPAEWADGARALAASPDGAIIVVTGSSHGVGTESDFATVAYAADTGAVLWEARYDGPVSLGDNAIAVAISPAGDRVFVTGLDRGQEGLFPGDQSVMDYATVAYDLHTGDELWVSRYNGPGDDTDNPRGMAVSPDGSAVYITGYSHGGDDTFWDYATIAYDAATGQEMWVARHNNDHANAQDIGYDIAVTDTRVFVTGRSLMQPAMPPLPASDPDFATVAYDAANGEQLWVRHYNGPSGARDNAYAATVVPHPLGYQVIVAGESQGFTAGYDFATVSYIDVDPAMYPVLGLEFDEIHSVQATGSVVTQELAITNPGGTDLEWIVFEDALGGSSTTAGAVATVPRTTTTAGRGRLANSPQPAGMTTTGTAWPAAEGEIELTHSASPAIAAENSSACGLVQFGQFYTFRNRYLRTFTLDEFDIHTGFEVTTVTFGVEAVTGVEQVVSVNLYRLNQEPLTYANMNLIGHASTTLGPQSATLVTVPVSGRVRGGSTLVVEIDAPDVLFGGTFFIGSNAGGQTAPSYLSAIQCGLFEPADLADLDLPDMHIVMSVAGFALPACDMPDAVPWAQIQPAAGLVDAGGSGLIEVTLNAAGLEADTYDANLCLSSNDPWRPWVMLPVTLTVSGDGPLLAVDPELLDFGPQPVGETGAKQMATLTNIGTEPVHVSEVTLPAPPFGRSGGDCPVGFFGFNLEPGASCTLAYEFAPGEQGSFQDVIEIISDAPGSPVMLTLEGQAVIDGTDELFRDRFQVAADGP